MPEGSDGIVRAEFQGDSDITDSSSTFCIMIDRVEVSLHSDDYNSSGGSDSENDSKVWDRSPRNGYPCERFHVRSDLHGSQKGIRSGRRIQPSLFGSQTTPSGQQKKQATSLPTKCKKTKPRRRHQSCNNDELKFEKKQSDFVTSYLKRVKDNSDESALDIQTAKSELERENSFEKVKLVDESKELIRRDNENLTGLEMYADNNQKKVEYATELRDITDSASFGICQDNKEIYEKEVEKSGKLYEEKAYIYGKEKKLAENVFVDTKMEKDEKDSFNIQQSLKMHSKKFEKDQTDMLEKQKMKKGDGQTSEKKDKEKAMTAGQSKDAPPETLEMNVEHHKEEQYKKARETQKRKRAGIDEIPDADEHHKEKLMVNLEQGKVGQKNGATVYQLDNKILDTMESEDKEEREQTTLKEVLDPQGENEMEKQDTIKVESLGFEVEGTSTEFEEPESTLRLQIAAKIWEKRQRERERFTSVDENSCNFSTEYPSTDIESFSQCASYKCLLESDDLSDVDRSCPDFHRLNIVQDSNRIMDHSENMFACLAVVDTEALWEQNKNKIIETIDTRSGKEEYFESYEEKFRKEVIDKCERTEDEGHVGNDENADITSPVETDNDDYDDVNHAEIENIDATENSMEVTDSVDLVHKAIEEREAYDIEQDNDKMNESDDKPIKIIDAEEKDEDVKEKVEVLELVTNDIEEKEEQAEMPVDASVIGRDSIVETGNTPNMPYIQVPVSKGISGGRDIKTRNTKHRTECTKTKRNKKGNKSNKADGRKKLRSKTPNIWKKIKRSPKVTLPKQKETGRLASKRSWNGRRYSMFVCGEFGRKCSTNSGGRGGSFEGDPNSSNNQRNNGDKNSKNRRNQNNKDRDSEDKNNNNNNSRRNYPGVNIVTEPEITVHTEAARGIMDVNTPADDFKRYKKKDADTDEKKHTNLENFEWLDKTTSVIEENKGPTVTLFARLTKGECRCVLERLDKPQELPEDVLYCSICLTVDSLLKHYAHCMSVYNSCDMCVKIFSLICSHVVACINDNAVTDCEIRICKTIKLVAENNVVVHMKTLWFQVRKKLARILDDMEEDVVQQPPPLEEPKPRRTSKVLSSFSGPLPSIPEGTPLSITSTSRSGSRVLHRKKSNLANVEEREQRGVSEEGSSLGAAEVEAAGAQGVGDIDDADESDEAVDSKYGLDKAQAKVSYSRPEIPVPDESDAIPTSSEEESVESTGSGSTEGSGQFGVMAGATRFRSLPMGPPGQGEPYFPSFKDRPTGKKGIGEVVYASKHQLVVVVTIWEKFKTQYLIEAKLAKHYTEEGVILPEFKSKLRIKGLRYQNEFQWVKVAHLGNGMTGKCHLATDFETDFKFCVKEIHISNYEKEEIELWSELDHPYVVQVYGAIRHGEKIYILQEFIEGGCLTEAINVQRKLSRRLSQLTALRYFQQLLLVLKYLKSRNILHEDLKADNILLNKTSDTVTIKVADFGLARRCQGFVRGGTKPVGTQTQWSPEKAEARVGYGFAAEIWAGICVLVHMLSGQPPWVRRYESFKALIVVIVEKSPPMEDIPRNIHESIKDLIKRGFTVCQGQRPTAEQLLEHSAFRLLDEATALQSINGTYSILESLHSESHTNQIDYDPNADLREIYRNLERDSGQGATGGNGTRRKDKKGSVVSVYSEEVPYYSNEYRVYTSGLGGEGDGKENENTPLLQGQITRNSSKMGGSTEHNKNKPGSSDSVNFYTRNRLPSNPDNNVDPKTHIDRFFNDIAGPTVPPQVQPNLIVYHPSLESIGSQKGNSGSQHSSLEHLSSGTVTNRLIPDFGKIGMLSDPGEEFPHNANIEDHVFDSASDDEKNEDFNFESALEYVEGQYTLPTVLNTSTDLSPGLPLLSAQSSSSLISTERSNVVGELDNQQQGSTPHTKPVVIKHAISKHSSFGDDHIQSFNEDDLFKSGSPPGLNHMVTQNQGLVNIGTIKELPETSEAPFIQGSSPNLLGNNPHHQINTSNRPSHIGLSLPQQFNPGSISRNPSVLPRSAPTNSMQTTVGQSLYAHTNPRNSGPLSAQEYQPHMLGRAGQNQQWMRDPQGGNPNVLQHNNDQMQKWVMENQSRQQQIQSQSRQQQIEMHSMQQQSGTQSRQQQTGSQSTQQHLQTQSRQQSGAQSRQKQTEIERRQYLLMQQTRQQPYLTQSQSYSNIPGQENNNIYMPNRDQDQVHMFQYGQGHTNIQGHEDMNQHGLPSSFYGDRFGLVSRSEFQPEDLTRPEILSTSDRRSPYDHISMPNQAGRLQVTPPHQLSLAPDTQFNPYQTSTPGSGGHHNGARPKVPQVPRQLFPGSQQYAYDRRNPDPRIYDPRQVYEQSVGGTTSRTGQYTMYPAQPRTPLLNPVINPRPLTPQEGQRMELRLDINRAQLAPEMPVLSHAQTAPVFSPPKTPSKKSPDFHRTMSQAPLMPRKSPSLTGVPSASPSQKDDKMSTSTSRSQFEEQDEAFKELGRTAEEALSQHSDHAPGMFLFNEDDIDEEINAEIDDRYLENPAESLAHVLDSVQDTSITLIFRSNANGKELKMNFFPKHASLTWEKILMEELDGFSRVAMAEQFGLQRFCLRREDGRIIDLDSCLGNRSCTVIMTEATDIDTWWIEGGMISK